MNCLAGKTMSQIVDLLTDTRDDRDGVLTWFIEQQHANGWRDVALTQTSENAAAILKLRRLIAERQQARVAKNYPELAQAPREADEAAQRVSGQPDPAPAERPRDGGGAVMRMRSMKPPVVVKGAKRGGQIWAITDDVVTIRCHAAHSILRDYDVPVSLAPASAWAMQWL